MHTAFFFVAPEDVQSDTLILRDAECKHLIQVLRKNIGDVASATDGAGNVYDFCITQIQRHFVVGQIQKRRRRVGEPLFRLTLAQALIKASHFEWLIEKGTEIGVAQFQPITTEHTNFVITPHKIQRWQTIARESLKQCGRSILPTISESRLFTELIDQSAAYPLRFLADNRPQALTFRLALERLNPQLKPQSGLILIGPEGGFTAPEVEFAAQHGFQRIVLGSRRLRSETAGLVAATILLEKMNEF